ncbi:MAG TPA: DEAD/DEAH box helicase [Acidimicrobiales bacterium]|nr:DEAD/DEAH box helicase [Acidimicrobiales bacterium]
MAGRTRDELVATRPDLDEVLRVCSQHGQLLHLHTLPERPGTFRELARPLDPALAERLVPAGGLWSHQAAAIDLAREGRSVAVATGTASGKSLCYQVPIAEAVAGVAGAAGSNRAGGGAAGEPATALMVFPTKALAQDQLRSLAALEVPGLVPATYDGDSGTEERAWARRHANVILTNPDMLHVGILPNHQRWATFLMRLRYVVLDELHTLRGIFGSHVAHVLRRLRRLAAAHGSHPTFVFTSATIGRPSRLASALCGLPVAEVDEDGSPAGERLVGLWNPPLWDRAAGVRASANGETAALLAALVSNGYRSIAFARSRKSAELVAAAAKRRLPDDAAARVRPYRGGYLAQERREIEAELFSGQLLGVAATNALELGVDIGGLDACVLDGFPGTIASFWQQVGRAGRTRRRSLAVLVAGDDALDQWFMAHPDQLLTRPPEPAVVNPANPFVLHPHLECAAFERALVPEDEAWWAPPGVPDGGFEDAVRELVVADELVVRRSRAVPASRRNPALKVSLRSGSFEQIRIVDPTGALIGTIERDRAFSAVHPGAVYLHQGQHFRVERLDLDEEAAWVASVDPGELTQARSATEFRILSDDADTSVGAARLSIGRVEVTEHVTGYRRKDLVTGEILGDEELDLPPTRLSTRGFWYTLDERLLTRAGLVGPDGPEELQAPDVLPGALHAAEHAGIGILPLFAICDRWDVGGVSTAWHPDTGGATILVYDGYPGGAGIAELGYGAARTHLDATLRAIQECPCEAGCPSCVQSPKCGNLNEPLHKAGAEALLHAVLDHG